MGINEANLSSCVLSDHLITGYNLPAVYIRVTLGLVPCCGGGGKLRMLEKRLPRILHEVIGSDRQLEQTTL
jgi:hypothetical protein